MKNHQRYAMALTPAGYAIKGDDIAKCGRPIAEVVRAHSLWLEVDRVTQFGLVVDAPPKAVAGDALALPMSGDLGPEAVDIREFEGI